MSRKCSIKKNVNALLNAAGEDPRSGSDVNSFAPEYG